MSHAMPVYRNETEAIQKMRQTKKGFFVRDRFYSCISEIGKMK